MRPISVQSLSDLEHPAGTAFQIRPLIRSSPVRAGVTPNWGVSAVRALDVLCPAVLPLWGAKSSGSTLYGFRAGPTDQAAVLGLATDTPDRAEREALIILYGLLQAGGSEFLVIQTGRSITPWRLDSSVGDLVLQMSPDRAFGLLDCLGTVATVARTPDRAVALVEYGHPWNRGPADPDARQFYEEMLLPRHEEIGPFALMSVGLLERPA